MFPMSNELLLYIHPNPIIALTLSETDNIEIITSDSISWCSTMLLIVSFGSQSTVVCCYITLHFTL